MYTRILVALDGSEFAEAALPAAIALARRSGGALRLLTVHDPGWILTHDEWGGAPRGSASRYLHRVQELVGPLVHDVSVAVRDGMIADEIIEEADDFDADVIVMATHGRGPVSRFWLGSVADQCARRARRPLLLVRAASATAPALGAMAVRRIVVPLDGAPLAETAIGPALELAAEFGASLALIRVVQEHAFLESALIPDMHRANVEHADAARSDAQAYLAEVLERLRTRGAEASACVATDDFAARAIATHADGDLVVMTSHARTGLARAMLGSVADTLVRSAHGPVLLLPPSGSERAGGPAGRERRSAAAAA